MQNNKTYNKGFTGHKHTEETKIKMSLKRSGEKNPSFGNRGENAFGWKTGKHQDKNGRWLVYAPEHPNSIGNYMSLSRLTAEKCLGRYLIKTEIIHHINENKSDDRPENLYLFSSSSEHAIYHGKKIKHRLFFNIFKKK